MNWRKQTKYPSCQLIAAINARIYLGGEDVPDHEFEELVDLVRCRYGGAIGITEAYPKLGLDYVDGPHRLSWIEENLPVEFSVHSPRFGFHAILAVEVFYRRSGFLRMPCLRCVNFDEEEIEWYRLYKYFPSWEHNRRCRSFRLAKSKES